MCVQVDSCREIKAQGGQVCWELACKGWDPGVSASCLNRTGHSEVSCN